jgi:hypothetical protein
MNQIHEFKARLLDKITTKWEEVMQSIPETYIQDNSTVWQMEKLFAIWADYHTLEARLE